MDHLARPRLRLFGRVGCTKADGQALSLPRQAFALAFFLLVSRRDAVASRVEAAHVLWPDAAGALTNLRQLLARIRSAQAAVPIFDIDATHVRFRVDAVDCDFVEFQQLIVDLDLSRAERLIELFDNGLFCDDGGEVPEWCASQAESVRAVVIAALSDLLERPEARANPTVVDTVAQRLLALDPCQEAAWRAQMRLHHANGATARAADTYRQCSATLRRELGVEPSEATRRLFVEMVAGGGTIAAAPVLDMTAPRATAGAAARWPIPRLVILPPAAAPGGGLSHPVAALILDDVAIGLCALNSIAIVAPHTGWRLRGDGLDDETTARFGIGYVLDTALLATPQGDRSRLSVRLYRAEDRTVLWAERFDIAPDSSETTFRSLVSGIVMVLADTIERSELGRYEHIAGASAYYWYLVGQRHLRRLELADARRASACFRRSLAINPEFAAALSGLARAQQREWLLLGRGDGALLDAAAESGRAALAFDPLDARGYHELALCNLYQRRHDESLARYADAERLSPQHADIIADFADALAHSGDPEKGLRKMMKAIDLNPLPPGQYWWDLAGIHYQLGNYEDALEALGRMDAPSARFRLAAACWAMVGDKAQASRCARAFLEDYPDFRVDQWLEQVPNRRAEDVRHYAMGLTAAGFS